MSDLSLALPYGEAPVSKKPPSAKATHALLVLSEAFDIEPRGTGLSKLHFWLNPPSQVLFNKSLKTKTKELSKLSSDIDVH